MALQKKISSLNGKGKKKKQEQFCFSNKFMHFNTPNDSPSVELNYTIHANLYDIITKGFKKLVFKDGDKLTDYKIAIRKCIYNKRCKYDFGEFKGNDKMHDCEVIKYSLKLMPLLPRMNIDMNNINDDSKINGNNNNNKNNESWSEWGKSQIKQLFNMKMDLSEKWKIDWNLGKGFCHSFNITSRKIIAGDEYITLIENKDWKNDKNTKTYIKKRLYVNAYIPYWILNKTLNQYISDSNQQMRDVVNMLKQK